MTFAIKEDFNALDTLKRLGYPVLVNGLDYDGRIAVGDTLEVNNFVYTVQAINEDAIVVEKLWSGK